MYCTLVHFTWEMCALAVPLKLVQLGYKYVCMYVCMYVSNIFPCICHTLVPEICVRPEMLHVFQYTEVLTCMIYN